MLYKTHIIDPTSQAHISKQGGTIWCREASLRDIGRRYGYNARYDHLPRDPAMIAVELVYETKGQNLELCDPIEDVYKALGITYVVSTLREADAFQETTAMSIKMIPTRENTTLFAWYLTVLLLRMREHTDLVTPGMSMRKALKAYYDFLQTEDYDEDVEYDEATAPLSNSEYDEHVFGALTAWILFQEKDILATNASIFSNSGVLTTLRSKYETSNMYYAMKTALHQEKIEL